MSEFLSWAQGNWNEVATFLIQVAFLVVGIWFARNILRTLKDLQEQTGALLRQSAAVVPAPLHSQNTNTERAFAEPSTMTSASPFSFTPAETQTISIPLETRTVSQRPEPRAIFGAEPMGIGTKESEGAWRSMVRWMQTPMRSSRPRGRVMRWLQAPVS